MVIVNAVIILIAIIICNSVRLQLYVPTPVAVPVILLVVELNDKPEPNNPVTTRVNGDSPPLNDGNKTIYAVIPFIIV